MQDVLACGLTSIIMVPVLEMPKLARLIDAYQQAQGLMHATSRSHLKRQVV